MDPPVGPAGVATAEMNSSKVLWWRLASSAIFGVLFLHFEGFTVIFLRLRRAYGKYRVPSPSEAIYPGAGGARPAARYPNTLGQPVHVAAAE